MAWGGVGLRGFIRGTLKTRTTPRDFSSLVHTPIAISNTPPEKQHATEMNKKIDRILLRKETVHRTTSSMLKVDIRIHDIEDIYLNFLDNSPINCI